MHVLRLAIVLTSTFISLGASAQVNTTGASSGALANFNGQPTALPPSVLEQLSTVDTADTTANKNLYPLPDANDRSPQSIDGLIFGNTPSDVKQNGFTILRAEAAGGDPDAKLRLGAALEFGLGTDKDPSAAFINYLEAANKNNAASQYAVGRAYLSGVGTDPNFDQSFKWLNSAYKNGQTGAAFDLAKAYQFGLGTPENVGQSEVFWDQAIKLGTAESYLGYADFLIDKKAKPPTDSTVKDLIWKAADLGNPQALSAAFGIAVNAGDAEQQDKWIGLLKQQAGVGNQVASLRLADAYLTPQSANFSPSAAFDLYKAAAANGNAYAQAKYGTLLLHQPALDSSVSRKDAIAILNEAAARGQPDALLALADVAKEARDLKSAYAYATAASELGGEKYAEKANKLQLSVCAEMVDEVCQPVPVFYITNRAIRTPMPLTFDNRLAPEQSITMGHSLVSIPTQRSVDTEQRPIWKVVASYLGFGSGVIGNAQSASPSEVSNFLFDGSLDSFLDAVQQAGVDNGRKKVIVFVHGFANTFDDATRRMAILSENEKYPGIPIVLDWASAGDATVRLSSADGYSGSGYLNDLQTVGSSCPDFKSVLEKLIGRFGSENVTVFAHSMGAQMVDYILAGCPSSSGRWPMSAKIGNLVFAAPDVDLNNFARHVDSLRSVADSFTIYVSANDMALRASQEAVGGRQRLGQGGSDRFVAEKINTIDATSVETPGAQNHSFVFDVAQVKRDLSDLFRGDTDPNSRVCPKEITDERLPSLKYWIIQPNCTQ